MASVLFGFNDQPDRMFYPSRLAGARSSLDALPVCPEACGSRLERVIATRNQKHAWRLASDLIADVLALVNDDTAFPPLLTAAPPSRPRPPDALMALAHTMARRYRGLSGVDAVAVSGSLARGMADRWSDIDLSVYGRSCPPEQERRALLTSIPETLDPLIEHACDTAWIDGTLVHVRYRFSSDVERMITAFPKPPEDVTLAEDLQCCQPLYDPAGQLQQWKTRIESFPLPLIAYIVAGAQQRRLAFAGLWSDAWTRRDLLHLYCLINQAANDWIIALFAMNHRFLSTPRWSHYEMPSFSVMPQDSEARLHGIVDAMDRDIQHRWGRLEALWEELIDCGMGISDFRLRRA